MRHPSAVWLKPRTFGRTVPGLIRCLCGRLINGPPRFIRSGWIPDNDAVDHVDDAVAGIDVRGNDVGCASVRAGQDAVLEQEAVAGWMRLEASTSAVATAA
jgi:hypothetical protein